LTASPIAIVNGSNKTWKATAYRANDILDSNVASIY
jgi:hypothetical protein